MTEDSTTRDPKLEVLMLDYGRAYTEANRVIPPDNIALSQLARAAKAVFAYVSSVRVPESASVHYRAESASVQEAAEAAARAVIASDLVVKDNRARSSVGLMNELYTILIPHFTGVSPSQAAGIQTSLPVEAIESCIGCEELEHDEQASEARRQLMALRGAAALADAFESETRRLMGEVVTLMDSQAAGWQPIETAPKDGTRVLLRVEGSWDGTGFDISAPVHQWMPLPGSPILSDTPSEVV